ncbi:erythrocyte membrane protein 1, PfEMP1, putative [Plasmodium reichenowi]|uniref:Erythrocyte membrane protein 1, PfEMP1, putative n=1 Tax=Plasmodium reichenowi TaxID=5854 RepID=A0A2P9D3D1_PLARE|nr:erythrocyte membrane protein 1, PfEMP1, putative [Plasmodium reichenowi]
MGSQSSKPSEPSVDTNESYKSARNVLENIGRNIKDIASQDAKNYRSYLKGDLKNAKFYHDFSKLRKNPRSPCGLEYEFHSNIWNNKKEYRHPCAGRNRNRFSYEGEVECRISKITGNKSGNGACAPYRRRELCDYIFYQVKPVHIQNSHDLLGNLLVTAKFEGQSIVNSYANNGTLNVCTALARSFADIGDIIRGKDLYLGNGDYKVKLSSNLRAIFKNIYDDLNGKVKETYKDDPNYYKLREHWWNANRDQIWKAITCSAPYKSQYFIKSSDNEQTFSSEYCGNNKIGDPLTNLDYVPQFLRWFDEWGEEFCRKKKMKLKLAKEACRGKTGEMYCSHNGYDCTKTIWKKGVLHWSNECTDCSVKCSLYESWLEDQRKEFEKQKQKYNKEIITYTSKENKSDSNINNEYYKQFYDKIVQMDYKTVNKFIKLLNEGRYCQKTNAEEEVINFTKTGDKGAFYRSKYCQVCPDCGVECKAEKCKEKENDVDCRNNEDYDPPEGVPKTKISVLYSGDEQSDITQKLGDFCNNPTKYKGSNYQKWECYYVNSDHNKCKMENNSGNNTDTEKKTSFHSFFDLWVNNLLIDTIKWENELKYCINNTNVMDCDNECNSNCVCFDKWVKQKEEEWKNMKTVLGNQKKNLDNYYNKLKGLFEGYFFQVMNKLNQDEAKWYQFKENLKKQIDSSKANNGTKDSEAAIELLLEYLNEKSTICKDNNTNEGCETSTNRTGNPCGNNSTSGSDKVVSVKQIAQYYKRQAYAQLEERGGRSNLKGDASKGQYDRKGKGDDFKGEKLCSIDKKYSNADRNSEQPCGGKAKDRFDIGKGWIEKGSTDTSYSDVVLPQRREHFCTSNLERLDTNNTGLKGDKAMHSLLGDVLLAAKSEADFIKKNYKEKNGQNAQNGLTDDKTVCRAMKSSFADIGDIIRGKDMWDKNVDFHKLEGYLVEIFGHIHTSFKGTLNGKYDKDKDDANHTKLRSDWWEANRDQVWKAMQCPPTTPKSGSITCDSDHTPLDDYIPQRLRWMSEWAEWYCKAQKEAYEELEGKCKECKGEDKDQKCWKGDNDCTNCTTACEEYKKKINKWKEQWDKIRAKYEILYSKARIDAFNGGPQYYKYSVQEEDKPVVDFLQKLHEANGGKVGPPPSIHGSMRISEPLKQVSTDDTTPTVYSTAAGYVHQELPDIGYLKQNVFCENPTTAGDKDKYTFKQPPPEYKEACGCESRKEKQIKRKDDEICNTVKTLIGNDKGNSSIGGCNPKNGTYPPWECTKRLVHEDGVCIPPRRRKFCTSDLTQDRSLTKKEDILTKFINCAAKETHFAWHRYKNDNGNAESELKSGTIPENFKRQMYYTFGDYRDIFFGTDISKYSRISEVSPNVITILQRENVTKSDGKRKSDNDLLNDWWNEHGKEIWEAMLCALTNGFKEEENKKQIKDKYSYKKLKKPNNGTPSLEEFSSRPQFLRWMTEWGEEFCKERNKLEEKVGTVCKMDYEGCNKEKKNGNCLSACKTYEKYIKDKEKEYTTQKTKFNSERTNGNGEYKNYRDKESHDYLKEKCFKGTCNCIQKVKDNFDYWKNSKKTYEDSQLENRCECELPPPVTDTTTPLDICKIIHDLFSKPDSLQEACQQKYVNGRERYTQWRCISDKTTSREATSEGGGSKIRVTRDVGGQRGPASSVATSSSGAICVPPRRRKLYIHDIKTLGGGEAGKTPSQEDLRDAFIKCAAIETFFSWHEYKKEKEREDKEQNEEKYLIKQETTMDKALQKKLEQGEIPEDFKRQMFYTFADYRDILFSCDMENGNKYMLVHTNSGDNKSGKNTMQEISEKIKSILYNESGAKTTAQHWWESNGKHIWDGMICALSYDTENRSKNENMHNNLIENSTNNKKYKYKEVTISSILISGDKTSATKSSSNLEEFSCRPTFFRWLEEWGDEFCRKRTYKLERIKDECRGKTDNKYSSGDGEDCENILNQDYDIVSDLKYPSCGKSCSSYKEWISRKKDEFDEQKKIYDKEFYTTLKAQYSTATEYLEALKDGRYSNNNTGENKINFHNEQETFEDAKNCSACPLFGVKCNKGDCSNFTENTCNGKAFIRTKDIKNKKESTEQVEMLVSDNNEYDFPVKLDVCKDARIFTGIKENKWSCKYLCDLDVCELSNNNRNTQVDKRISIRILFKRWLEYFFKDYSKLKNKLNSCTNNGEKSICINECKSKCVCAQKWVEEKIKEWKKVRKRFFDQYNVNDSNVYEVNSFLVKNIFSSDVKKALDEDETLEQLQEYGKCDNSGKSDKTPCEKKDVIEILLDRLTEKITTCQKQHYPSGKTQAHCVQTLPSPPSGDETHDIPDDPDQTIDIKPGFCKDEEKVVDTPPKEPCEIVDEVLKHNPNEKGGIDNCNPKTEPFKWDCDTNKIRDGQEGACMPPRRQKLCVNNLQKLSDETPDGLRKAFIECAAIETHFLWKYYKEKHNVKNDKILESGYIPEDFKRMMYYTFGDYRDLCLGKDIGKDVGTAIDKIKSVFKSIGQSIDEQRETWWENNAKDIWEGMLCALTHKISDEETKKKIKETYKDPPHNFASRPQFLRWFSEWGDEYCQKRRELEKNVKNNCTKDYDGCKNNKGNDNDSCVSACKDYEEYITDKKEQYESQKKKFDADKNQNKTGYEGFTSDDASEYLKKKCFPGTCDCMDKVKDNNDYWKKSFENFEKDILRNKCKCKPKVPPRNVAEDKGAKPSEDGPCDIVKELLEGKNRMSAIGGCKQKDNYPGWICDPSKIKSGEEGACIPPRRQKLCVHFLQQLNNPTEQSLRDAFIKCAANETFFLWDRYKKDKNGGDAHETLNNGIIPEEFMRQMFYTFGDYRDIFLGKDIGNYVNSVNEKINAVFQKIDLKTPDNQNGISPKWWWDEYAPAIWQGMLCGLSYASDNQDAVKDILTQYYRYKTVTFSDDSSAPTLSKFAERPQFLRWFTEWAEHFCREHKTQLDKLMGSCKECTVTDNGTSNKTCEKKDECDACKRQCQEYQKWLKTWQENYKEQKKKFLKDKKNGTYKKDAAATDANSATNAREYLDKQLKNMTCTNGNSEPCNYNCMENVSKQQKELPNGSNDMPESLDDEPEGVKGKCKCVPDECNALSVNDSGFPDAGVFGGGIYNGKCKGFEEHIPKKIETPQYDPTNDILKSTIPIGIALALGSIAFLYLKKKPKSPVDLLRVIHIHKGEYGMPTKLSSNRYIPYRSGSYKGKSYIYIEGDTDEEKYIGDITSSDITSSESEYEELDINDIYPYQSPKYKTLIEVVLEPSKTDTQNDIPSDNTSNNKLTDEEWNELKQHFISGILENAQKDLPKNNISANTPMNTQPNTLYFDKPEEKPFITSIHDRNLYTGEDISYNVNMSTNNDIPISSKNDVYSGIDLINDSLNSGNQPIDIYDEVLKRKENELFGTKHPKHTNKYSVAKPTNTDPVMNQIDLLHKWLDRHRDMCEKWENRHERLAKLKEEWVKDNRSGDIHPSGNIPSDSNKILNTNFSIEIDMDNPKPINQFSNMDTNVDTPTMDNMEDDIYYDVNDDDNNQPSVDDITMDHNRVDVPKKVHVEMKILNNTSNGSLQQKFPISDVWNI